MKNEFGFEKMSRTILFGIIRVEFNNYQILLRFVRYLNGKINYLKTILRVNSGSKVKLLMENYQFLSQFQSVRSQVKYSGIISILLLFFEPN